MPVLTGVTRPFDLGFFGGSAGVSTSRSDVGTTWDVALGGRGYMIDKQPEGGGPSYTFKSLPLLQRYYLTQTDGVIGEASLNPADYWRRSVDHWGNGAGQLNNDHANSIRSRFRISKGIDCWTPGQISLLHDVTQIYAGTTSECTSVMCGDYLYVLGSGTGTNNLQWTLDGVSYTPVTGTAFTAAASLCSDGYTVWVVDTTTTYYTTRGAATYATWFAAPRPGALVRTVKGRLFVFSGTTIYTSSGAAGAATATAFYTHPNPDFAWTDATGGPTAIYFAGYSGGVSHIYQTAVTPDGTNLTIPTAAATLPDGELATAIQGYLGVMLIGSTLGVRIAAIDSQGNLTVGDLIETNHNGVLCFEPQSHFVWFGWGAYDGASTGLGRIDLGTFNDSAPAYASDLMANFNENVSSVVTFLNKRAFTTGPFVFLESNDRVASGSIYSGALNFALPDPKTAIKYDIAADSGGGTITTLLSVDGSAFGQIGGVITTSSADSTHSIQAAALQTGLTHEIELVLKRQASDHTESPIVDRWTLMVNPAPPRRTSIEVWLDLHRELQSYDGRTMRIEPQVERNQIETWLQSNDILVWQDSDQSYSVTVDDYEWRGVNQIDPTIRTWEGSLLLTLKIVS